MKFADGANRMARNIPQLANSIPFPSHPGRKLACFYQGLAVNSAVLKKPSSCVELCVYVMILATTTNGSHSRHYTKGVEKRSPLRTTTEGNTWL